MLRVDPSVLAAHGVKLKRRTHCDEYTGTREALIGAGIVRDGFFPGDPGRRKAACRYSLQWGDPPEKRGDSGCRGSHILIGRSNHKFLVTFWVSDEEVQAREDEVSLRSGAWRWKLDQEMKAVRAAEDSLSHVPASAEQFTQRAGDAFWTGVCVFLTTYGCKGGVGGYSFDADTIELVVSLMNTAYCKIVGAKPRFSHADRVRPIVEARQKAAKVDLPLQQMLRYLSTQAMHQGADHARAFNSAEGGCHA